MSLISFIPFNKDFTDIAGNTTWSYTESDRMKIVDLDPNLYNIKKALWLDNWNKDNPFISVKTDIWNFGTQDFTISCFYMINNSSDYNVLFAAQSDFRIGVFLQGGYQRFFLSDNGSNWALLSGDSYSQNGKGTLPVTLNELHHMAFVRYRDKIYGFLDGKKDIEVNINSDTSVVNFQESINLGRWGGNVYGGRQWISEFKIDIGNARWTEEFTPPKTDLGTKIFINTKISE